MGPRDNNLRYKTVSGDQKSGKSVQCDKIGNDRVFGLWKVFHQHSTQFKAIDKSQ